MDIQSVILAEKISISLPKTIFPNAAPKAPTETAYPAFLISNQDQLRKEIYDYKLLNLHKTEG